MTIHLVTFASPDMERSRVLCASSAKRHGVDNVYECGPSEPSNERGYGFWRWKPQIINNVLTGQVPFITPNDNDILIYSDAGVEFINNVNYIIDRMDQDVFLFGNNWEHAHWCKRDVIEAVWPQLLTSAPMNQWMEHAAGEAAHPTWNRFGKQAQASVIFFRVSDYSRAFVAEWLKWCLHKVRYSSGVCTDEWRYLIDDSPSILPNHPEFQEHRHDQSILTTLSYREGIKFHWWPAVYNRFVPCGPVFTYEKGEYQDDYPPLFHHHRLRDSEWPSCLSDLKQSQPNPTAQ